jgi:hypothetical protein
MTAVNQWNQALIAAANVSGNNATALAYGTALAQQNMNTSFEISGVLAGEYMPVVYGLFTSLFLGFFLILIILMALPIGFKYFTMYFELAAFLTIWPPLMAIYNYVDDLIINNHFQSLAMQGFSINSAHSVSMFVSSQLGWMGYLSWSVPIMSYALVTGSSYAMVGAISSMDSAGKSAASTGGAAAASGNVNIGNTSMGNYGANKVSSVRDVAYGDKGQQRFSTGPGGLKETLMDGKGNAYASSTKDGTVNANERLNANGQVLSAITTTPYGTQKTGRGGANISRQETLTGARQQNVAGMNMAGLTGEVTQTGSGKNAQVTGSSITGSKSAMENFVKETNPSALPKLTNYLKEHPDAKLSFTTAGGKMAQMGIVSGNNLDYKNLMASQTGKINTTDNLTQYNGGLRYNNSTDVTTGLKATKNNIVNTNFERFKKSLKGYENLTKGLNKGEFGFVTDNFHDRKNSYYGHNIDVPSQYGTSIGYGGLYATPEIKPFITEGLSGNSYPTTTTALGSLVGNGVGQFFTNKSGFQSSSASSAKTAFKAGIKGTYGEMSPLGGVQGFAELSQEYSRNIGSSSTKDQMLNRTAMYFQGVTHLLANDKSLTPGQKEAKLNSFIKTFETTTMQNLSPITGASNMSKRINAIPSSKKFNIAKGVYKKDSAGGKPVTETQFIKGMNNANKNYVLKKEQGVIDNNIKNGVNSRFVKPDNGNNTPPDVTN